MNRILYCRWSTIVGLLTVLLLLLLTGCGKKAQNDSTGRSASTTNQAGPGQMDTAARERFRKFREEHQNGFKLMETTRKLGQLERDGIMPLTPAQAKSILVILTPLRGKADLTEDDAKIAIQSINALLTEQQLSAMDKMTASRNGRRSDAGTRQPGNNQRPRGNRQQFNPDTMGHFNPLAPPKDPDAANQSGGRTNQFFDLLLLRQ